MAGVTPNQGQNLISKAVYKAGNSIELGLYTNDVTPGAASVVGDFTPANANGVVTKSLVDNDFTIDAGGEVTTPDQDFNAVGGDVIVYGWYMTMLDPVDGVSRLLLHAERDPNAPVTIPDGGVPYRVSPSGVVS